MINFEDIYGRSSDVMSVALVTITCIPGGESEPMEFRMADDNVSHDYKDKRYEPYPFSIDFPDESQNSTNQGKIIIANLDDSLIALVRKYYDKLTLRIDAEYVKGGEYLDVINVEFKLSDIVIDAAFISASLVLRNVLGDAFPSLTMTAITCPGLI